MRLVVLSLLCVVGCISAQEAGAHRIERGLASWYGYPYHGQQSASGEIYDQEKLTAAHRTLPFGTRVRIRRLDRNRSVVVRINDRGPFVESRIIDLSHAAAVRLGMVRSGVAPVTVEVIQAPPVVSFDLTPHRRSGRDAAITVLAKRNTIVDLSSADR